MVSKLIKRILDIIISVIGLIVLSPLLLFISFAVLILHGSPIIFKQTRPGLHGKPFTIYKFRTMKSLYGPDGSPLPDEDRLTRFGNWLRSTSLDELPELANVLIGDMSIVGPRPLLLEYMDRYTPEQARRHEVKPGITGWAQVNGRNNLSWEEKFRLDVWYVDNWSLALDFRVLLMTVGKVLSREDISAEGCATMPEFLGTKESQGH
jgi:lipopolysaccharide/colanic/teichoic acid biosynthesis glycosyltransferase